MALKKACCPICHNEDNQESIFQINGDATVCFCPNCMAKLDPKEAIDAYEKMMDRLVSKADSLQFESTDSIAAYKEYASIMENTDSEHLKTRLGRIISLITVSTLRRPLISQALELYRIDYDNYLKNTDNLEDSAMFYYRLILVLATYHFMMKKRLSHRDYFYDLDCLTFYYSRLKEVVEFFTAIEIGIDRLDKLFPTEKVVKVLRNNLKRVLERDRIIITREQKYAMCNGLVYIFSDFDKNGEPLFIRDKYAVNPKLPNRLIPTINKTKHHSMIRNDLFKNRRKRFVFYRRSLKLMLATLIIDIGLTLAAVFTYNKIDTLYWAIIVSLLALSFLLGLSFVIVRLIIRNKVKTRHELFYKINPIK